MYGEQCNYYAQQLEFIKGAQIPELIKQISLYLKYIQTKSKVSCFKI